MATRMSETAQSREAGGRAEGCGRRLLHVDRVGPLRERGLQRQVRAGAVREAPISNPNDMGFCAMSKESCNNFFRLMIVYTSTTRRVEE